MKVSRLTVDKLGIKLYDRVTAVLAELIANAYDADAADVRITVPFDRFLGPPDAADVVASHGYAEYSIVIADNGHGMDSEEVNAAYLNVGSDRRQRNHSDSSRSGGRLVMGRKGIGKLAPFGICRVIEVVTAGGSTEKAAAHGGFEVCHLILRLNDILQDTSEVYAPELGPLDGSRAETSGTTITLRDFARKRVPNRHELDRQLAARFGLEQEGWRVTVTDAAPLAGVPPEEKSFTLGELRIDVLDDTLISLADRPVNYKDRLLPVRGWLAYSKDPYKDPAMAGVRIFARGKFVSQTRDFGISAGFTGEYKLRSYLVGSVHADWLDAEEDLIRSDRQDIIWSSDLGEALTAWGQSLIKELAVRGESSVQRATWDEFLSNSGLERQLAEAAPDDPAFRDSVREAARALVDRKDRAAVQDPEHVKRVVQLAFAIGPHRSLLAALREVSGQAETTFGAIADLFEQARIAEMYSLGQIAAERVEVVESLERLVGDAATLEDPLQRLIEGAPWLLAPEWTPLGMNESLQRVRRAFEAWYLTRTGTGLVTTAISTPRKEPDFVLLHDAGVLWIVEIKRMDYHLSDAEFLRAVDYLGSLNEFLNENPEIGRQFPHRRLTFVCDYVDKLNSGFIRTLDSDPAIDRRTWHELLDSSKRAHRDFLAHVNERRNHGNT